VSEPGAEADRDILAEVERLIAALQSHADSAVREQVAALLQGIDTVHRIGLGRLVAGIQGMAGEAFLHRLCGDPAIRLLLMSYGLVAVDRRLQAEEALDAVRGHLHAGGVDVELRDVVGSVVYVRLHAGAPVDEAAVRHDLEEALHDGLLGFQELVIGEREAQRPAATVIPAANLKRVQRPVYRRALAADALAPGQTVPVEMEGQSLLLANVEGEVYAVRNRCGDSPLPLQFGQLEGAELICSWHGCRWDMRSGRLAGSGERDLSKRTAAGIEELGRRRHPAKGLDNFLEGTVQVLSGYLALAREYLPNAHSGLKRAHGVAAQALVVHAIECGSLGNEGGDGGVVQIREFGKNQILIAELRKFAGEESDGIRAQVMVSGTAAVEITHH